MKLIVNANVIITNKEDTLLLDEIIAKYRNAVEDVAVNVEPFKDSPVQQTQVPTQQTVQSVPVQTAPTQTVQQTVPVQPVQQPVQTQPVQTAVPVAEKAYTLEDLQRASSTLVQAGKIQLLKDLLEEFNSPALTSIPLEQYGAFALRLRELGAAI
jgi:hypothetical protein|nr:MAG TPA: hypothetical protein [Caudoviricetes sp.]